MNIKELLEQYNFHDSLVENLTLQNDELELNIELCNWKQYTYNVNDSEIVNLKLIFKKIKNFIFDVTEEKFDCDSILDFSCKNIENDLYKVKIVVDGDTNIKIIKFIGQEVEVKKSINF